MTLREAHELVIGFSGKNVSSIPHIETDHGWHLRPADLNDIDGLYALTAIPLVCRYLCDGVPPDKEFIAQRVTESAANAGKSALGMWFLENSYTRYAGCVELRQYPSPRSAEIIYLLDPRYWKQGLALRMSWTVITHAFLSSQIDSVIAGTDVPNTASLAVMPRLGMHSHKDVQYPLGAGVEYVLHRNDVGPLPKPVLISFG